ncbi:GPI mannosyltransferase 1-like [Oppia nitens]|uniref:GPI mannosyltransferase 1-like n=1 Tax=Oppia nitens TaxID=1686743 RepID=UPI0023DA6258|nr:GPI mannosyltransferase 1-like [Oppia nitens]
MKMLKPLTKFVNNNSFTVHLLYSLIIRLLLIILSEIQDKVLTLKYTDIDYQVYTDGSRYVWSGESPFNRLTYRYTPLIAFLLVPNITLFGQFGKILFAVLDVITGGLIYSVCGHYVDKRRAKICAAVWLYNPLPAIISTRGSAEAVITTLVLLTLKCVVNGQLVFAGLVYGFAIHFKLYPIIYFPTFYLYLTKSDKLWKSLKPNIKKMTFFTFTLIGFIVPTYWSYHMYGQLYLDEGWLYHLHRKDPQHNFSPYFYIYHIIKSEDKHKLLSYMAFIPQMLSVLLLSFYYCLNSKHKTQDLMFGIFAQTAVFVTLNKVITSQYFLWYFSLLPLSWPYIELSAKKWLFMLIVWLLSQAQWLLPAYLYEFEDWQCLQWVWTASCMFVALNLVLLITIVSVYKCSDKKQKKRD